jgi:hypothetical protein
MGWDGMGRDGMGRDRMGWMGWDGWDGMGKMGGDGRRWEEISCSGGRKRKGAWRSRRLAHLEGALCVEASVALLVVRGRRACHVLKHDGALGVREGALQLVVLSANTCVVPLRLCVVTRSRPQPLAEPISGARGDRCGASERGTWRDARASAAGSG